VKTLIGAKRKSKIGGKESVRISKKRKTERIKGEKL
jgi:hypothetical protein